MKGIKRCLPVAAVLVLVSASAFASSTATSNMNVSATVSANCTISAGALSFGAYDPVSANASANLDQTAALTVVCTNGASATITMGQGSNADTGSTDAAPLRRMKSGSNYLSYSLYSDGARSTTWGNTVATGASYTGVGTSESVTAYGRVASGQNVPAGSYSDTVVATITF